MNDKPQVKEQTSDPTQWRYPSLVSPNRTVHIANLENEVTTLQSQLTQAQDEVEKVNGYREKLRVKLNRKSDLYSEAVSHLESCRQHLTQANKERDEVVAACAIKHKALADARFFMQDYLRTVNHPGVSRLVEDAREALDFEYGKAFLERMKELEAKVEIVYRVFGLPNNTLLKESLTAYRDDNEKARQCQWRLEWLHKCTGIRNDKDDEGYEWGVARVKFDDHGRFVSFLWTDSDSKDLDSEMEKDRLATPPTDTQKGECQ